jgi:hypothetical protein
MVGADLAGDWLVPRAWGQGLDAAAYQRDLDHLARELAAKHKNLFAVKSPDDFQRRVDALKQQLPSLSPTETQLEFSRLIAELGDGHTQLAWDFSLMRFLPFNARWFDDAVAITAVGRGHEAVLGGEILKINGFPIEEVLSRSSEFFSHDNAYGLRAQVETNLNLADLLQWACRMPPAPEEGFTLEVRKNGEVTQHVMSPVPQALVREIDWQFAVPRTRLPLSEQKSNLDFWSDWLAAERTVYFKYNRCRDAAGFSELVTKTKAFMQQNRAAKFVLDLRHNAGGNSAIIRPLLRWLKDQDGLEQRAQLYVIVGRETFSSGLWAAYDLKKLGAIVVGEPSGGKPNHFGEVKSLELPESGWRVFYSTKRWTLLPNEDPPYLAPDLPAGTRVADYFAGRDAALEAILQHRPE